MWTVHGHILSPMFGALFLFPFLSLFDDGCLPLPLFFLLNTFFILELIPTPPPLDLDLVISGELRESFGESTL